MEAWLGTRLDLHFSLLFLLLSATIYTDSAVIVGPRLYAIVMGVMCFALLFVGRYGLKLSDVVIYALAMAEALVAALVALLLFLFHGLPMALRHGLYNPLQLDRFSYVLMVACVCTVIANGFWAVEVEDQVARSEALAEENTGYHYVNAALHRATLSVLILAAIVETALAVIVYNVRCEAHKYECVSTWTYLGLVFLVLHNFGLWAVNADVEVAALNYCLERLASGLVEGMWPVVVEYHMLTASLMAHLLMHKPLASSPSSKGAEAALDVSIVRKCFGIGICVINLIRRNIIPLLPLSLFLFFSSTSPGLMNCTSSCWRPTTLQAIRTTTSAQPT